MMGGVDEAGKKIEAGPRAFWGSSIAKSAILFSIINGNNAVYEISKRTAIFPTAVKQHVQALQEEGVIDASEPGSRDRVDYTLNWQALAQEWVVYHYGWSNFVDYKLRRIDKDTEESYARKELIREYLHKLVQKDEHLKKLVSNKDFVLFVKAYFTTIAKKESSQRQITIKNAFTDIFHGVYPVLKKNNQFDFLTLLVSKIDEIDAEKIANDTIEAYKNRR